MRGSIVGDVGRAVALALFVSTASLGGSEARASDGPGGDADVASQRAETTGAAAMAWCSLEGVLSYRDSASFELNGAGDAPNTRIAFGLETGLMFGRVGDGLSFVGRQALGFSLDWPGFAAGSRTAEARVGGMRLDLATDLFGGMSLGRSTFFGAGLGWHVTRGPLADVSSLTLSALLYRAPAHPDDMAWYVRVVPARLIGDHDRAWASPLIMEWRAILGSGLGIGVELQYIAAPEPGDREILAEGFAAILRVGIGVAAGP